MRVIVGLFLMTLGVQAVSDPSTESEIFALSLSELLEVSIASSTLTNETIKSVPSSVSIYTHDQIKQLGLDYLHELMNLVPGFQSFRQEESGDEYYHSIRGRRSSTASREVLILLNGQRFNRESDNAQAVPLIRVANIEKVEFIRGPTSAIYGSNAFSGVVSIVTRKNDRAVRLGVGEKGQYHADLSYADTLGESDAYISLGMTEDDGHLHTIEQQTSFLQSSSRDPRQGLDVLTGFTYSDFSVDLVHLERDSSDFLVLGEISDPFNATHNTFSSVSAVKSVQFTENLSSEFHLRAHREHYEAESFLFGFGKTSIDQESRGYEFAQRNNWLISERQSAQFGLEYRYIDSESFDISTENFGSDILVDENVREIAGIYFQHQWQLNDDTSLVSGLRGDSYSGIQRSYSPRLGLIHQITEHQTLKLLYGEAFRAPTFNETILEDTFGFGVLVGNPDLNPETIQTTELIWMGNWETRSLSVAIFENTIENSIVRDTSLTPDSFLNSQDSESSQGLEIEFLADISHAFSVRGSYSVFKGLSPGDLRQANSLSSLILNYAHTRWNYNFSAHYAGEREMLSGSNRVKLSSYWKANAKILYQACDHVYLSFQAKNLFDRTFLTPTERATFSRGIENRARELTVAVDWSFN